MFRMYLDVLHFKTTDNKRVNEGFGSTTEEEFQADYLEGNLESREAQVAEFQGDRCQK